MKIHIPKARFLSAAVMTLAAALVTAASAQAQTKIAIIDLKKVFENYWKRNVADAQLKERAADFEKVRKGFVDEFQKADEEYKKLMEGASDQAVSTDERDKRKTAAEKKLREINEIKQTLQLHDQNSRETLGTQTRRMRDKILGEIREVIDSKAKSGGYSLVVDTAAETPNLTPIVLYDNGQNDLTDDVLAQLNAGAPAGAIKPPGDSGEKPAEKKGEKTRDEK
ncbi:MAG TPA: OmpH family outer membrane protein [Verrucomicrobiae bacterium]|nr:OmpH family outer membrane protein [Verrucomicrobiae bacterium]